MHLTTLRLPPYASPRVMRGWPWLLLAGVLQPLAMEAYNVAAWYWPDPAFVRLVSLAGPMIVIGALVVALGGRPRLDGDHMVVVNDTPGGQWLLVPAAFLFWAPWAIIGIEHNWSYRCAFLGLQLLMVVLWWRVVWQPTSRLLEIWAKRVGFLLASVGVLVCVLAQFVLAETPFLGVMATYDPTADTASAEVQAGMSAAVWLMPVVSVVMIIGLAGFDLYRRKRRSVQAYA